MNDWQAMEFTSGGCHFVDAGNNVVYKIESIENSNNAKFTITGRGSLIIPKSVIGDLAQIFNMFDKSEKAKKNIKYN